MAGIAGAATNNSVGVAGVGWDASILPVKVCDSNGSCPESAIATGIRWAVDNGAQVINLSLGSESSGSLEQDAVAYAWSKGVVVVASSGNCGDPSTYRLNGCSTLSPIDYPAAYPNVLGVGAVASGLTRASFSSYGTHVDLAAPGVSIYSTYWSKYAGSTYDYMDGTSMASPVVAGAAAVIWSRSPSLTNAQVVSLLTSTATDLGAAGWDQYFGHGLVNLRAAVQTASLASPASIASGEEPQVVVVPPAANATAEVVPGRVIVRLRTGVAPADLTALLTSVGGAYEQPLLLDRAHTVTVGVGAERDVAALLAASPLVEFAEPDYVRRLPARR